jgi:hypothetical protein
VAVREKGRTILMNDFIHDIDYRAAVESVCKQRDATEAALLIIALSHLQAKMVARRGMSFSNYEVATGADAKVVTRRIMIALERRVLNDKNVELRGYFEQVAAKTTSPLGGASAEEDGISGASDEDIEQTALLLCHHDSDGDGLLSPTEFSALLELVSAQVGTSYTSAHIDQKFSQYDIDRSGFIDLNELLLLRPQRGLSHH